jgi:S1-C subfamily serine protease
MLKACARGVVVVTLFFGSIGYAISPDAAKSLYEKASPSLVAVRYTWENELGRRELTGSGVVVSSDGLVMSPIYVFDTSIPDDQMKEFKILVAHEDRDVEEVDAEFCGRDERSGLAFLKAKGGGDSATRQWKPVKFEEVAVNIGDPVYSVGILPEMANYKPYFMEASVSAKLRGEQPQVLVQGGLAAIGSPVFNPDGKAVGVVTWQPGQTILLNDQRNALGAVIQPPKFYIPTRDFALSLADPPKPGEPMKLPWMGVTQMTGLNKDVAEVYGLANQPAVQLGDVIPDQPGAKGGLQQGDIIVKVNGQPIERGDEPDELPQILRRQVMRMKVGDVVTFSVIRGRGEQPKDVKVTLEEMPKRPNSAKRWFAEDLGFSAREMVFMDTYARRLEPTATGVIVALIRPQSAANSARLQNNDLITELNREPVKDLEQFKKSYQEFRKANPREAVVMVVQREGNTQVIRIEPPQ